MIDLARDTILNIIAGMAPWRLFFNAITACSAVLVGLFAFLLRRETLVREKWVHYFGIGFLIFGAQYAYPTLVGFMARLPGAPDPGMSELAVIVAVVASGFNNLFFLAAARALLRRKRDFPWWAVLWACLAAVADHWEILSPWHRLPDALLSALSLSMLGWAMFRNLRPRRRLRLAALAFAGAILYGGVNIVYALHLPVTTGAVWPGFKAGLEERLTAVETVPELARAQSKGTLAAHAVDTALFGAALVLKLLLALGGLLLVLKSLQAISPPELSETLEQVSQRDIGFFTGEGILQAVGQNLDSDRATLYFRLPGLSNPKVAWWQWERDSPQRGREPQVMALEEMDPCCEGKVLAQGGAIEEPRQRSDGSGAKPRLQSHIAVPIQHRGHVTGCLRVDWRSAYSFTETAVQQARRLAELLAPMVEERRQLAALDRWGRRVQNLPLGSTMEQELEALAGLVHDTLAPLATGIVCWVGFRPAWTLVNERSRSSGFVDDLPDTEIVRRLLEMASGGELTETVLEARGAQIGKLLLVWPAAGSDPRRPVVHSDSLHRKTLAVLVANSIFEAAHNGLGGLLNRLQDWLGLRGVDTREEWQEAIDRIATEAGLLWAAALVENQVVGTATALAILGALPKPSSKPGEEDLVQLLPSPSAATGTRLLLALRLRRSQATLWLAVGRTAFGRETDRGWPWRGFLDRLAEVADLALARIVAIESVQRLQKEADHLKGLVTPGTDPAIFLHDIRKLARNFQFAAQSLDDARKLKLLEAPPNVTRHISALHASAQRLYDMTDAIMKSKPADGRKAYPLVDPIQGLQQLLKPVLDQHRTRLEVEVSADLVVVFPFHLAHQALLSLVSNSIDATEAKGTIRIEAENDGAWVLCHVIDNGPGVDPDLGDPFELGKSTKGTGGRGLFLVRQLLRDHGGDAHLTESSPGHTVFTLRFPKEAPHERKESLDHRG